MILIWNGWSKTLRAILTQLVLAAHSHGIRLPRHGRGAKRFQGGEPPIPPVDDGVRSDLGGGHGHCQRVHHLRAPRRQGHGHLQKLPTLRVSN